MPKIEDAEGKNRLKQIVKDNPEVAREALAEIAPPKIKCGEKDARGATHFCAYYPVCSPEPHDAED